MGEIAELIRKYAIKNAVEYGTAKPQNVIGKVITMVPNEQRSQLGKQVEQVVQQINKMSKADLIKEYKKYEDEFDQQYRKKTEQSAAPRMELEGASHGNFVTRYAPEPSGYMHIGHAKALFMAQEFSRIYDGKLLLFFDDTNPDKESQLYVDQYKKDLAWLGVTFDNEYYASDSIKKTYEYAKLLVKQGDAYACECSAEQLKQDRFDAVACKHRNTPPDQSMHKLDKMLANEYNEGQIVIRLKADIKSQNTALRDPTILRIKSTPHYRQGTKYTVWPTYDLSTPINDSINGVTDVIRSKEYELRDQLYIMVLDMLNLRKPRMHTESRLAIKGNVTQKRVLNKLIAEGVINSFDDPRLMTIAALRRRGILPQAIHDFVIRSGMSKKDTKVTIEPLLTENKRLLDPVAKHLFYVEQPVKLALNKAIDHVGLAVHSNGSGQQRSYKAVAQVYVSKDDAKTMKQHDNVRLKGLCSIAITKTASKDNMIEADVVSNGENGRVIQWVPADDYLQCSVLIPGQLLDKDNNINKRSLGLSNGYVEGYAKNLVQHETVQLERYGFCTLDDKKQMSFIFISK